MSKAYRSQGAIFAKHRRERGLSQLKYRDMSLINKCQVHSNKYHALLVAIHFFWDYRQLFYWAKWLCGVCKLSVGIVRYTDGWICLTKLYADTADAKQTKETYKLVTASPALYFILFNAVPSVESWLNVVAGREKYCREPKVSALQNLWPSLRR